jgi:dihydrofolate reductase
MGDMELMRRENMDRRSDRNSGSEVVLSISMSLDGFINDREGSVSSLYPDVDSLAHMDFVNDLMKATGAVVMGRRTFEMAENPDDYADNYEYQVPIFVITSRAPERMPKQNDRLRFTFVEDGVESAIRQAKEAAGDLQVTVVGGAKLAQLLIRMDLVDIIHVGIIPVMLGAGTRLFENLGRNEIPLQKLKIIDSESRIDIWYRVIREASMNRPESEMEYHRTSSRTS